MNKKPNLPIIREEAANEQKRYSGLHIRINELCKEEEQ